MGVGNWILFIWQVSFSSSLFFWMCHCVMPAIQVITCGVLPFLGWKFNNLVSMINYSDLVGLWHFCSHLPEGQVSKTKQKTKQNKNKTPMPLDRREHFFPQEGMLRLEESKWGPFQVFIELLKYWLNFKMIVQTRAWIRPKPSRPFSYFLPFWAWLMSLDHCQPSFFIKVGLHTLVYLPPCNFFNLRPGAK